jgi:hypothetical protein
MKTKKKNETAFPAPGDVMLKVSIDEAIQNFRLGGCSAENAIINAAVNSWMEGHLEGHECSEPCHEAAHRDIIRNLKNSPISRRENLMKRLMKLLGESGARSKIRRSCVRAMLAPEKQAIAAVKPKHKKLSKPCHFCKRPTLRMVRFGYLTFDLPCCVRCQH